MLSSQTGIIEEKHKVNPQLAGLVLRLRMHVSENLLTLFSMMAINTHTEVRYRNRMVK